MPFRKGRRAAYEVFHRLRHLLFATPLQGAKQETQEVQDLVCRNIGIFENAASFFKIIWSTSNPEDKWKLHIIQKRLSNKNGASKGKSGVD